MKYFLLEQLKNTLQLFIQPLFKIKRDMGSDRKSRPIRTIFDSVHPWPKTYQCTECHQNISIIATCEQRKQNRQPDR